MSKKASIIWVVIAVTLFIASSALDGIWALFIVLAWVHMLIAMLVMTEILDA